MGAATRAAVTAGGAAAVAVAGYISADALQIVILGLGATFAVGWPRLLDLPRVLGASIVIALSGLAAILVVRFGGVGELTLVVGLAIVAAFIHQMLRRDGRPRLVESVSGVVSSAVVVISASGWAAVHADRDLTQLVVAAAATIAGAALVTAIPAPMPVVGGLAAIAGGGVGLLTGSLLGDVGALPGALVGLAAGILTASAHVVFGQFPASRQARPAIAAALLLVLAAGIPVYASGYLLT